MDLPDTPVSDVHGFDRGTPVDRHYLAQFMAQSADAVRGEVAELKNDKYFREFATGPGKLTVIDIDRANPRADLFVDLVEPDSLPMASFDCIQAIQFFTDPAVAIRNLWQALRPGGTLLLTAPAVGRMSVSIPESDCWRINPPGFRLLFAEWEGPTEFVHYGNLKACLGMLIGLSAEEIGVESLLTCDPAFPLLSCVRAVRAGCSAIESLGSQ
jgi:SAM-dependent methyltransferase